MPGITGVKGQVDNLNLEKKLEIWKYAIDQYATSKGIVVEKLSEEIELLKSLPTPFTDSDKVFIEKNKHNKDIQREKMQILPEGFIFDGIFRSRDPADMEVFKDIPELIEWKTMFSKKAPWDYGDEPLPGSVLVPFHPKDMPPYKYNWKKLPLALLLEQKYGLHQFTKEERQQAADIFWWSYWLLGQLLNYPKAGIRRSNGVREKVGTVSSLYLPITLYDDLACIIYFNVYGAKSWNRQDDARSFVFRKS